MDHKLLERYFRGDCAPEENERVAQWLSQQDEDLPEAQLGTRNNTSIQTELWSNLNTRISADQQKRSVINSLNPQFLRIISIAALIFISASVAYLFIKQRPAKETILSWKQVKTEPGKQLTITLSDGSSVQLNGGSVFEYPSQFSKTSRSVKMIRGEGYFSISTDVNRPFKVNTPGKSSIQVLGTQFNVKLKPVSQSLDITLIHGKIAFTTPDNRLLMKPGEQLLYDTGNKKVNSTKMVDTDLIKAWKDGIMWFKDTPILEVFAELEQYYGVKFIHNRKIEQQNFNGKFNRKSLSEVLKLIQYSTDLKFTIDGSNITVYK